MLLEVNLEKWFHPSYWEPTRKFLRQHIAPQYMEPVTAHFPSNRMDKTRNVAEFFPSNKVELVQEHFPSNRKYGENNGEGPGEMFVYSEM